MFSSVRWWIALAVLQFTSEIAESTRKASCNGWMLTSPQEGSFACNPAGVTISMPGTRCVLHCDAGYRPQHEVLVCSETGGWVPSNTPECQVDSTMTLVIVLSIVGSIVIILGLSVVYARTSKRCRGRRRRLEEEDPEAATRRKEVNDTSTYYGQVKRLRRKRRLQAERQRKLADNKRRKEASMDRSTTKQPINKVKRGGKTAEKVPVKNALREKAKRRTRERLRFRGATRKKQPTKQSSSTKKRNKSLGKALQKKQQRKSKTFQQRLNEIFCLSAASADVDSKLETYRSKDVKKRKPKVRKRKVRKQKTESSSSSSSSSDSSIEEENPCKKSKDNGKAFIAETKKPPQTVPPTTKKKPPPRPPAPILPTRAEKTSGETAESSGEDKTARKAVSSGYSSDGNKTKQKHAHSESGVRPEAATQPRSAAGSSKPKRTEIMAPGTDPPGENVATGGNPYANYPAALSYRQYHDFENDYRRTTGDYHPQYSNVKLIPLENIKKKGEKNETEQEKEQEVEEQTKPVQGGVKYISISEEEAGDDESDCDESKTKRNRRKRAERYEDPSARDKRKKSINYPGGHPINKVRKDKKRKHRSSSKTKDLKKGIEDEMIIDQEKQREKEPENRRKSDKSKIKSDARRSDKTKHKKRVK